MNAVFSEISSFFEKLVSIFSTYNWLSDTLDLFLLAFIIYYAVKIIRDTRALTLAKGIIVFAIVYILVLILNMQASAYIFGRIFDNILVILIVIFAPEIRNVLEKIGTTKKFSGLMSIFGRSQNQRTAAYNAKITQMVNAVCKAASDMSDEKIGALLIFEKNTPLGEIINTGTVLDAEVSPELLGNVFYPKSPLHDGAAVIRNNRLYAAGCILPLTSKNDLSSALGTRHRAAIGMSEQSDAMVLVVSEETGGMSMAVGGTLHRNISDGEIREMLLDFLIVPVDTKKEEKKNGGGNDGK